MDTSSTTTWKIKFVDRGSGIYGCEHYERGCLMRAACCDGKFYACHLCHDKKASDHMLDRFSVREMQCMYCGLVQPAQQVCAAQNCKKVLGKYYCNTCHLWSNSAEKSIYHCTGCGICRVGRGLGIDFFHCSKCKACLAISLKDNHKCVEDVLNNNCPVCWEHLFSSRDPLSVMGCGHSMHKACFDTYTGNGFYRCPTCQHELFNPTELFLKETKRKAIEFVKSILRNIVAIAIIAYFIDRILRHFIDMS